jgi:hypothetical protein
MRCFTGYKIDKEFLSCSLIDASDPVHTKACNSSNSSNCRLGSTNNQCTLLSSLQRADCHKCSLGTSMTIYDTSKCESICFGVSVVFDTVLT